MKNQNKTIIAGLVLVAAMLSISITYSTAFAQDSDLKPRVIDKPIRPHTNLVGTGAAVDQDDHGWRSHFKMGIVFEPQTTDGNADTEYKVKRGQFVVGKHGDRHVFSVAPDTWRISSSPDKSTIEAGGSVQNQAGEVFDVKIKGEKVSDLQQGHLYLITGIASNADGKTFDLFYISAMFDKTPSLRPLAVDSGMS